MCVCTPQMRVCVLMVIKNAHMTEVSWLSATLSYIMTDLVTKHYTPTAQYAASH